MKENSHQCCADEVAAAAKYYAARLLLSPAMSWSQLSQGNRPTEALATLLDEESEVVAGEETPVLLDKIQAVLSETESAMQAKIHLKSGLNVLREELGLSSLEAEIFLFASLIQHDSMVWAIGNVLSAHNTNQLVRVLAFVHKVSRDAAHAAISENSSLIQTGLLTVVADRYSDLDDTLNVKTSVSRALLDAVLTPEKLYARYSRPLENPHVELSDYPHIQDEACLILDLLKGAVKQDAAGINILLYGPPGTGKTQLARTLITQAGLNGLETREDQQDGEQIGAIGRLRNYKLGQRLMARTNNSVFVFDEVEEILDGEENTGLLPFLPSPKSTSTDKAWKNRLLEENPKPSIWIANQINRVDDALLRRFTYTLEVKVPPRKVRRKMVQDAFADYELDASIIDEIAEQENLTPADLARTRKALSLAGTNSQNTEQRIRLTLEGRSDGIRLKARRKQGSYRTLPYDLNWINTNPVLASVTEMLARRGQGKLLFYGPPGTGKTAFAKHLAKALGVPLLTKRASDLLGPFVGMTEMQINAAFEQAYQETALLLIDEADSFLQDRRFAQQSWESSQVNELLSQIDDFDGFLVLTTNFSQRMDPALARRIDLNVEFKHLSDEQGLEAVLRAAAELGIEGDEIQKAIQKARLPIRQLALGDISSAMRQVQLRSLSPDAGLMVEGLWDQLRARDDFKVQPIGFVA